ncbi:unnamed protein product [Amoebophrya sp. A25]|nr:unnamed protein product [Amoebophrya sp. A25]|eukprot:GSA25T00023358001.1
MAILVRSSGEFADALEAALISPKVSQVLIEKFGTFANFRLQGIDAVSVDKPICGGKNVTEMILASLVRGETSSSSSSLVTGDERRSGARLLELPSANSMLTSTLPTSISGGTSTAGRSRDEVEAMTVMASSRSSNKYQHKTPGELLAFEIDRLGEPDRDSAVAPFRPIAKSSRQRLGT